MRPALFCAAQLIVNVWHCMMLTLCSIKMTSEHLLSANLTTPNMFLFCQTRKINLAKSTAFTVCVSQGWYFES